MSVGIVIVSEREKLQVQVADRCFVICLSSSQWATCLALVALRHSYLFIEPSDAKFFCFITTYVLIGDSVIKVEYGERRGT